MTRSGRPTVGAFGMLAWDQFLVVDDYPEAGTYRVVRRTLEQSGGTTGNMAAALARLGADVAVAARVGHDEYGSRLRSDLESEGCFVEHILTRQSEPTDRGVIVVSGRGVESDRTIFWIQGAKLRHGDYLPVEAFFARDLVIVDVDDARLRQLIVDLPSHVSPRTRIFGTMTYLEEIEPEIGLDLALRHDFLAGNARELRHITGKDNLDGAIRRFRSEMVYSSVRFVAVSSGAEGCLLFDREREVVVPAFKIDAVDPTGAGDAFAAGIAWAILHRWDLERAGRFANAMGALATRELGARSSLPTLIEIERFLDTAELQMDRDHAGSLPAT